MALILSEDQLILRDMAKSWLGVMPRPQGRTTR